MFKDHALQVIRDCVHYLLLMLLRLAMCHPIGNEISQRKLAATITALFCERDSIT